MAGTTVYYNGVCMQDCLTTDFEHVIEYDDSKYQAVSNRFRVTFESTVVSYHSSASNAARPEKYDPSAIAAIGTLDPAAPASNVKLLGIDTLIEIQSLLNQNGMDFVMSLHNTSEDDAYSLPQGYFQRTGSHRILLAATGVAKRTEAGPGQTKLTIFDPTIDADSILEIDVLRQDVLDCDNGPRPISVSIVELTGSRVFRVRISFEICRPIVSLYNADDETTRYDPRKAKGCIKNRWSVLDSMDEKGAVTHTIRGTLTVSDIRYKPNAMRLMAFPLAFPFARLASRENEVSEDGKTLGYTVKFTHAGNAPPLGVRDYDCQYAEEASIGTKGFYFGAFQVKVRGWFHRSTDNPAVMLTDQQQKHLLLRGAISILYSRIRGINLQWNPLPGQVPVNTILHKFKVVENLKEPELELICVAQFTDSDGNKKEFPTRLGNIGTPISIPNYSPKWWPIDNEWGRLLNEDVNNVFLRSSFIPKSAEGETANIDYMNQQRHRLGDWAYMTPRITQLPDPSTDVRARMESPTSGTTPTVPAAVSPDTVPVTPNPLPTAIAFTAIESKDLKGDTVLATLPPTSVVASGSNATGVADVQRSGYSYLSWHSETHNDTNNGVVQLPLSKPRKTPISELGALGSSSSVTAMQTSVAIRLFAPFSKRVYCITAERVGEWPEVPIPHQMIVRRKPGEEGSTATITNVERLLRHEFLPEGPVLGADQCTQVYKISARYEYALDLPIAADPAISSIGSVADIGKFDIIPIVKSPILKSTFAQTSIPEASSIMKAGIIM